MLPFGLTNFPSTFVRLMRQIFGHHKRVIHYYDDFFIFFSTFEEHISDLTSVLNGLKLHGLTAKPSEAEIAYDRLIFLGHKVGGGYMET